jgi:hypothetical protein
MWMLLTRRMQISILVLSTVLAMTGIDALLEFFVYEKLSLLKLAFLIIFLIGSVAVGVAHWVWRPIWRRFPICGQLFFPDLNGTWKGMLQTAWKDAHEITPAPIETTIWIRQNLFTFHVQQETNDSPAWSSQVFLEAQPEADRYRLRYLYDDQQGAAEVDQLAPHEGVATLEMSLATSVRRLTGHYYTSGHVSGDIDVVRVSENIVPARQDEIEPVVPASQCDEVGSMS